MATKIIALDAGHGLKTSGKRTPDGIHEWELNDKVRDYAVEYLKDYDCKCIFPDNNEGSKDESLSSRKSMYLNEDADAVVSIHHNALTGEWYSKAIGVEVWVDENCTKADMELAKCIHKRLAKYTGLKDRGIKEENWTVINQNRVPAVLTEGGFMDSKADYKVITSTSGQKAYAKAIAEGLIEFLGLKKKKTTFEPYLVKITTKTLNVRTGAGQSYKQNGTVKKDQVFTIVEEKMNGKTKWGKLKSGAGWISLQYTKKV